MRKSFDELTIADDFMFCKIMQDEETMIEKLKSNEQARSEYRFISGFEMDALYYGRQKGMEEGRLEGIKEGKQEGIKEGIAQGAYQKALETASVFKRLGIDIAKISEGTGLSREEIERL